MDNSRPDSESLAHVLDKRKPYWWRRLTEVDPISLEPIKALRFPPFELGTASADVGIHATYFDGRVLANYLVSTGSFMHPISRRELTPDECVRLDEYLTLHKLGDAGVLKAFELKDQYKNGVSPEAQVRQLQEAAAALLQSLYNGGSGRHGSGGGDSRGDSRSASTNGARNGGRRGGDDNDASADGEDGVAGGDQYEGETIPLGGASLESVEDFPSLCWVDREQRPGEARTCSSAGAHGRGQA